MKITFDIPHRVWSDSLDPLATEMQAELGLPEPKYIKRGKGGSERFIDVDGNYEPGNCRWATRSEQNRNRRRSQVNR